MAIVKTAILDRDGVINYDSSEFIKSPDEWIAIPESLEAIARLSYAGWRVVIATNQSGLARGLFDMDTLNDIHAKMHQQLSAVGGHIDSIFICPHGPLENCACRKPLPGLFLDIGRRYELNLADCFAVGDSLRDIQAAHSVGCQTSLVLTGNGMKTQQHSLPNGCSIHTHLATVVDYWLKHD